MVSVHYAFVTRNRRLRLLPTVFYLTSPPSLLAFPPLVDVRATSAKKVATKPVVNEDEPQEVIAGLREELGKPKAQLAAREEAEVVSRRKLR